MIKFHFIKKIVKIKAIFKIPNFSFIYLHGANKQLHNFIYSFAKRYADDEHYLSAPSMCHMDPHNTAFAFFFKANK